ncbi:MAG: hypothetical protein JNL28_06015 [Planctomycetes bacterium]|nr:hypothetical protein [Planctomycetota bacterium]
MIAICAALLGLVGNLVTNGDFETGGAPDAIPGWVLEIGARTGGFEPVSRVTVDASDKHGGAHSLHFSGDDKVRAWQGARQELEARPGATYTLNAFAKTKDVRVETVVGANMQQYSNCYVALFLRDDSGIIVAKSYARPRTPTTDWEAITAKVVAPRTTRTAEVFVFLSMSGDLWLDDVEVGIENGDPLPPEELILHEGFETATALPKGWVEEFGASNGAGATRSTIAIDRSVGEGDSPGSLHFSGSASTQRWFSCTRKVEVVPGDALRFSASVKTENVRKEGIQFENLHLSMAFESATGRALGTRIFAACPTGTQDWTRVEAKAIAPAETAFVTIGMFLSMSGDAWFDRIELMRRGGFSPAYADWKSIAVDRITLKFAPDHPQAAEMKEWAAKFAAAYGMARTRMAVAFDEPITVYVYTDEEQGKRFTGRALAFASPHDRTVHQTLANTLGHELSHVIAQGIGYAQVELFGEGLAVWCDGSTDEAHHDRAAQLLRNGKLPTLATLLDDFRSDEARTYPAAGSFCGYVIATAGLDALKRIYVTPDPVGHAQKVFGKSLATLDEEWREFLRMRVK